MPDPPAEILRGVESGSRRRVYGRRPLLVGLGALALFLTALTWPVSASCCASDQPPEAALMALDCCSQSAESCGWTAADPTETPGTISIPARLAVAAAGENWPPHDRLVAGQPYCPSVPSPPPLLRSPSVLRI
jgi:hypothetical protein